MSERQKPRKMTEAVVCCLSCGATSEAFVNDHPEGGLNGTARCPKCSNRAFVTNLRGLWHFMQAASKEIAQLKLDMIDAQSVGEGER